MDLLTLLIYALMFAGVLLAKGGARWLRKVRQAQEPAASPSPVASPQSAHDTPVPASLQTDWGHAPAADRPATVNARRPSGPERDVRPSQARAQAQAQAQPRAALGLRPTRARRILRTPEEIRQGVVALTLLGPCRALAPYEDPGMPQRPQ